MTTPLHRRSPPIIASAATTPSSLGYPLINIRLGALLVLGHGSTRQSVRKCILCGFLESDEFGLGGCQALRFQQQVIEVAVTPTTAQQRFDVSIDGFHYPQPYFNFAVVKNSFQMFE